MRLHGLKTRATRGFTLIEVMISIFLVLLLIYGINEVFRVVTATVGAGQALASANRDGYAAQMVFQHDIGQSLSHSTETPFLIIDSQQQVAFRNKEDFKNDRDGDPTTIDLNGNNSEGTDPGEKLDFEKPSDAVHRIDTLGFFATGHFDRQTGNSADQLPFDGKPLLDQSVTPNATYNAAPASFAARQTAREAYIWFGHLWLPTNPGNPAAQLNWSIDTNTPPTPSYPGLGTATSNPHNYFASDWILGRMQILLTPGYRTPTTPLDTPLTWTDWKQLEPTELGGSQTDGQPKQDRPAPAPVTNVDQSQPIPPQHGDLLTAIDTPPFVAPPVSFTGINSPDQSASYLPLARYFSFVKDANGNVAAYPDLSVKPDKNWRAASWDQSGLYDSVEDGRYDCAVGSQQIFKSILVQAIQRANTFNYPGNPYPWRWWESLCYRFRGNSSVSSPLDPAGVAQSQSIFLRHCTQFIVEYAGDFVKQDNDPYVPNDGGYIPNTEYGDVEDVYFDTVDPHPTDGVIDYYVDKSASATDPTKWIRKIRWYGFPRDIDGDGHIYGYSSKRINNGTTNNDITDVVPLRDIMLTGFTTTYSPITNQPRTWAGHAAPSPFPTYAGAPFEKDMETNGPYANNNGGMHPGYLPCPGENGGDGNYATTLTSTSRYLCAFGPSGVKQNSVGGGPGAYIPVFAPTPNPNPASPIKQAPGLPIADDAITRIRMIRITITLDDPNNRLSSGQTFQYVIALP